MQSSFERLPEERRVGAGWSSILPGLTLLSVLLCMGPRPGLAQDTEQLARELADIEGDAERLLRGPLRRTRLRSATHVEERLTDGELFYRLRDYVRASIIFTDIVDNYPRHRAFPDALFLLADSLYRAGDHFGARTRFRELVSHSIEPAYRPYLQRALGRLIEVAIHTRNFDGVEDYFTQLSRIPPSEIEATTNYYRAKYLYNRAVPMDDVLREGGSEAQIDIAAVDAAREAFETVAQGSPYYPHARYFTGVIYTLRGQYPQAIEAFRRVLRTPAETREAREVAELTRLALGRLYYETDQLDQAIEAYQRVSRTSTNFHVALYEVAWVYIRMGDSTRAERALEILSVAAPDSRFIPDGKILRGNLLLRNGRFDDANRIFREVAREFGPVRRELDQIVTDHEDPAAYFRQLVRENMESFDSSVFLPPLAQRWAALEGDMDRALGVLSDLAQARRLVRETSELVERLNAALSQPNQVAVFADLRHQMERVTTLRNRISTVRRSILAIYERQSDGDSRLREQRHSIERVFEEMPSSESDITEFNGQILRRYRRLERELGRLEVELQGMEARIVAMERYLSDTAEERDPEGVAAIQHELSGHRASVDDYRELIRALRIALEASRLQVGPGDARYRRHSRLRSEHSRLAAAETDAMAGTHPQLASMMRRLQTLEGRLDEREQTIETIVTERSTRIRGQLEEESVRVAGYRAALTGLEAETEEIVGGVTYANFQHVQERFYGLVLRADVGRIDVAWQQREEYRTRVEMLTRDRAREMQALDDEFREIMDETSQSSGSAPSGGEVTP